MALKVKNPKKNLADILIEKERLNESYDSSSAVSLKTLEETAEEEGTVEKALKQTSEGQEEQKKETNRPNESMVNETEEMTVNKGDSVQLNESTTAVSLQPAPSEETTQSKQAPQPQQTMQPQQAMQLQQAPQPQQAMHPQNIRQAQQIPQEMNPGSVQAANPAQAFNAAPMITPSPIQPVPQPFMQGMTAGNIPNMPQKGIPGVNPMTNQLRKPWEEVEDYNPPRKKRGRPYQGYSENTHVQSIYVRNDLYEYIMVNYVGHGRKHSSFNKFVNAAINNYLRQLEETD